MRAPESWLDEYSQSGAFDLVEDYDDALVLIRRIQKDAIGTSTDSEIEQLRASMAVVAQMLRESADAWRKMKENVRYDDPPRIRAALDVHCLHLGDLAMELEQPGSTKYAPTDQLGPPTHPMTMKRHGEEVAAGASPEPSETAGGAVGASAGLAWVPGDRPDTPKGSARRFWVTLRSKSTGKLGVASMTYLNGHVMPLSDHCDAPPSCAKPHKPEPDGYFEEYEWTCWSNGYCDYCETEWVWDGDFSEIIAPAHCVEPEPYQPNE